MSPDLPPALKVALDQKTEGLSRNDAAQRSAAISHTYRSGGGSGAIRTETDALTYALARMPATYAAVAACLTALAEARRDFTPESLLDIGAGPGTATWAAAEAFTSLQKFALVDANAVLHDLAIELTQSSPRLSTVRYEQGDARKRAHEQPSADLVVASYMINELNDAERAALTDVMWSKTRDTLLIVEPGTPAGYARIIDIRAHLIGQGAHVIAPCPHDATCPLVAPDWCHFSQRLSRSRTHKHLKGAELPYEDERFSYVVLSRSPLSQRPSRVLAEPQVTKIAVTAKLCTADGLDIANIPHRNKEPYKQAKRWRWGDAVPR
ncbi:ribosomal protein RSM22 (predicted rRNA methylase) [Nitrobacteraceae bacterium AZCC 1564]